MHFSLKNKIKKNPDNLTLITSMKAKVIAVFFNQWCQTKMYCSFHVSEYGSHRWHVFFDFQTCCCKRSLANGMAPPPQPVSAHIV